MADSKNTLAESPWPIRVVWPIHLDRIRECFGQITMVEYEWYGRVTLAESENTLAESPWLNPNGMAESEKYFGRITMADPNGLAEFN